jgi:cytochrome b6-f complex iron-sulfur subunit
MDRRKLLKSIAVFVPFGSAFAGFIGIGIRFITPVKREIERRIFTIHLDELQLNSTRQFRDLRGKDLLLVRTAEREVKAISTTCTHLGCSVYWQQDKNQFYCPCHQGVFDKNGRVISGPPPRPLDSYRVELEGDNVFIYYLDKPSDNEI